MRILNYKISLEQFKSKRGWYGNRITPFGTVYINDEEKTVDYDQIPLDVFWNKKRLTRREVTDRYDFIKRYEEMLNMKTKNCRPNNIIEFSSFLDYFETLNLEEQTNELRSYYSNLDNLYKEYNNSCHITDVKFYRPNTSSIIRYQILGDNENKEKISFKEWVEKAYIGDEEKIDLSLRTECNGDVDVVDDEIWDNSEDMNYIDLTISIINTIDDMGEYSIIPKDWIGGIKYLEGDEVIYDDRLWKKNNIGDGYGYDDVYKEIFFNEEEWSDVGHDPNNKNNDCYKVYYTFDYNSKLVTVSKNIDLNEKNELIDLTLNKISEKIELTQLGPDYSVMNNNEYKIYNVNKYVSFKNNDCPIFSKKINNKTREYTIFNHNLYYRYNIGEDEHFIDDNDLVINGEKKFVNKDNNFVTFKGNKTFDWFFIKDSIKYYIKGNEIYTFKGNTEIEETCFGNYVSSIDEWVNVEEETKKIGDKQSYYIDNDSIFILKPYYLYSNDIVTGYTESRIDELTTFKKCYDDIGNQLPGILNEDEIKDGCELDIPYKVGNVSNLSFIKKEGDIKYYWGNYLESIDTKDKKYFITYRIGCILKQSPNEKESYSLVGLGVKYTETFIDEIKLMNYYTDNYNKILIKYHSLTPENRKVIKLNEYSNKEIVVNLAKISVKLNGLSDDEKKFRTSDDDTMDCPLFREEYKFGSSSLSNVDGKIDIDRGIASSFEKHLKLLEINSMESLEQYGNGFYKIIKN